MFELRPYRNNNHMTTYDPFRDMEALERAFFGNRDFLGDVGTFKTDIQDKGDHYLLEADLPGMKKEDIAIDIDGDNLTIKAERRNEHEEKDKREAVPLWQPSMAGVRKPSRRVKADIFMLK